MELMGAILDLFLECIQPILPGADLLHRDIEASNILRHDFRVLQDTCLNVVGRFAEVAVLQHLLQDVV